MCHVQSSFHDLSCNRKYRGMVTGRAFPACNLGANCERGSCEQTKWAPDYKLKLADQRTFPYGIWPVITLEIPIILSQGLITCLTPLLLRLPCSECKITYLGWWWIVWATLNQICCVMTRLHLRTILIDVDIDHIWMAGCVFLRIWDTCDFCNVSMSDHCPPRACEGDWHMQRGAPAKNVKFIEDKLLNNFRPFQNKHPIAWEEAHADSAFEGTLEEFHPNTRTSALLGCDFSAGMFQTTKQSAFFDQSTQYVSYCGCEKDWT